MLRLLLGLCGVVLVSLVLWQGAANPPREDNVVWQSDDLSMLPVIPARDQFTLEVTATLPDDQLAEWGIWLDNGNGTWTLVAINGGQYVTARTCPEHYTGEMHDCTPFIEPNQGILTYWKAFHHIRVGGKPNTIRLHYAGSLLELRLNNESMWNIPFESSSDRLRWGLWKGDQHPHWQQAIIWN